MISGGAFAIAALSAIIGFYMLVSFYSSHKMDLPALTIVMTLAAIILSACLADGCFAKQGKLIGCILVIMTLFFAFSGITSLLTGLSMREAMGVLPTSYIISFYLFLFATSAILGAISALVQKRSKNLCLAFAIIALAAAVVGIIGNALMQTPLAPNTLKALMEGVGFLPLV